MKELTNRDPDVELVWSAFQLRPEGVPALDPNAPYIQRVWKDYVQPMARKMGLTMNLPPVQPRTRLAHEAAHWARAAGYFDMYNEALFRAFFERGEDIGDENVLVSLASAAGMDAESLRAALVNHTFGKSVQGDLDEGARLEISGVPAFVAGEGEILSGVQSVEALEGLVLSAKRKLRF